MTYIADLTAEFLRELLDYNPETGCFTWLVNKGTAMAGSEAGTLQKHGYWCIRINRRFYKAHRLAWLHVYGVWPACDLDHINRIKTDNRIANLREVNQSENMQNTLLMSSNTSGYRGVYWHKRARRWLAQIVIDGEHKYLGLHDSVEVAYEAYKAAASQVHTHNPAALEDACLT